MSGSEVDGEKKKSRDSAYGAPSEWFPKGRLSGMDLGRVQC